MTQTQTDEAMRLASLYALARVRRTMEVKGLAVCSHD